MPTNTQDMSNTSENINISTCANCGKGEEADINLKSCNACMMVKYCSRDCQIAHRPQHKNECKKKAKELHDEKLFKQPPPREDCPICMIRLPTLATGSVYMDCCGKIICRGCAHAFQSRATKKEHGFCPFCRTPPIKSGSEETIKRFKKRMELNDSQAIHKLGCVYRDGMYGIPQDSAKALELWHRAAELGRAGSYHNIGHAYRIGYGVEINEKKAANNNELAAMAGSMESRNSLGLLEGNAGNFDRALKHFMIAVRDGALDSLEKVKHLYEIGYATKDDYAKALRSYQEYLGEIKSNQRDKAAAFKDEWKYF